MVKIIVLSIALTEQKKLSVVLTEAGISPYLNHVDPTVSPANFFPRMNT